jgi:hypothetical protein
LPRTGQPIPDDYEPLEETARTPRRAAVVTSNKLEGLSYPELQKLVKARGLRPAGRKKTDLIQALS